MGKKREIKVTLHIPEGVDLSELVTNAINTTKVNIVKRALDQCETPEERNRMLDEILARIV